MSQETIEQGNLPSIMWPLFMSILLGVVLIALLVLTGKLAEGVPLRFLVPYKQYIVITEVIILGLLIVESGAKCIYAITLRRATPDVAAAIRIIARLVAYGIILSVVVSVLTANAAAALTIGSFAGLVAGFASQTVMGNALAGIFMTLARPIHIGDRVTISANSGVVKNITLLHTVLDVEDREIMIPSSTTVTSILVRHKQI